MPVYDYQGNVIQTGGGGGVENTKKYVVFGDSIPAFGAYSGGTGTIVNYLQSFVGGTWYDFAIGGTTMSAYRLSDQTYDCFTLDEWADSVSSGDFSVQRTGMNNGVTSAGSGGASVSSIIAAAEGLDWDTVDTIVLAFGTNDLGYDVSEVGSAGDAPAKNGTMVAALKYAVQKFFSRNPFFKIVVCGVMFRHTDNPSLTEIQSANSVIKQACASIGIRYVDLFAEMGIDNYNYQFYLYDGTHPSFAGKVRYATTLANYLYPITNDIAYYIKATGTNITFGSYAKSVYPGQNVRITVAASSGYTIQNVVVTMGGTDISSTAYANGVVQIANVTGSVEIEAAAE